MSYILEALKKSEQERNPDKVPDLTTHHQSVSVERRSTNPWAIPLAILIIINMAAIYWFVIRDNTKQAVPAQPVTQTDEREEPRQLVDLSDEKLVAEDVDQPAEATGKPAPQETVSQPPVNSPEAATISQPNVTATATDSSAEQVNQRQEIVREPLEFTALPHISELSQGIQNQLPAINFTTHIYVKDGGSFVIINNRNMSEGMTISNGFQLEKIVREGVILSFRDRYFTLNSMESWLK